MRSALLALALLGSGAAQADGLVLHTVSWHTRSGWDTDYSLTTVSPSQCTLAQINVAKGCPDTVTVKTWTERTNYNNVNPGLGYRWDNGWNVGGYYNSYKRPSFYVAKDFMLYGNFGVVLGVATGYQLSTGHELMPIASLLWRQPITSSMTAVVMALPPLGHGAGVVHLAIEYAL